LFAKGMRYVNFRTKRVYAMIASMPNMICNFVWFAIKKPIREDCAKVAT
jgi:hypothetical protein